ENIISEVIMSIRHYITAQEPVNKLVDGRLRRWVLKPLCVALRIERFLSVDKYPMNFKELLELSSGLPQAKAAAWIMNKEEFHEQVAAAPSAVLIELLEIATGVSKRIAD